MSTPIANAIARMNARAVPKVDTPGVSFEESEILLLRHRVDVLKGEKEALLASNHETRMAYESEVNRLQNELASACSQRDDAEKRCAEMQGRLAAVPAVVAPATDTRYDSLVAEFADLRVAHGSCGAKEEGLRQVIAELRKTNDMLTAQIQACLTEDDEEPEEPAESPEGGCDIEVVRGSDDRVRSLRVRYTK